MGKIIDQLTDLGQAGRGCSASRRLAQEKEGTVCLSSSQGAQMTGCSRREGRPTNQWASSAVPNKGAGVGPTGDRVLSHWMFPTGILHIQFALASFLLFAHLVCHACSNFPHSFFILTSPSFALLLFSSSQSRSRSENLPHVSHIRETAFCLFARRNTATLPESSVSHLQTATQTNRDSHFQCGEESISRETVKLRNQILENTFFSFVTKDTLGNGI